MMRKPSPVGAANADIVLCAPEFLARLALPGGQPWSPRDALLLALAALREHSRIDYDATPELIASRIIPMRDEFDYETVYIPVAYLKTLFGVRQSARVVALAKSAQQLRYMRGRESVTAFVGVDGPLKSAEDDQAYLCVSVAGALAVALHPISSRRRPLVVDLDVCRRMRSRFGLFFYLRSRGIVGRGVVDGLDRWHGRRTKNGYAITAACSRLGEALGIDRSLMPKSMAFVERDLLLPAQGDLAEAGYALRWSWRVKGRARMAIDIEFAKLDPRPVSETSGGICDIGVS